ncbi:hypothetical protein [Haploplasma axanthum]|uniref:Uncharacterized protein n=1 Tax=Haploplasma axanthum TaxID=29552 RepID=A0A449BBX5_HAPAX|nr:hypothetical protein [Haploplasma axanthum]VEU79954.1 Uncharacterised protein [Haploplasma axanthum]
MDKKLIKKEFFDSLIGYFILSIFLAANLFLSFKESSENIYEVFNGVYLTTALLGTFFVSHLSFKVNKLNKYGYARRDVYKIGLSIMGIMLLVRLLINSIFALITFINYKNSLNSTYSFQELLLALIRTELMVLTMLSLISLVMFKFMNTVAKATKPFYMFLVFDLWIIFIIAILFGTTIIEGSKDFILIYPILLLIIIPSVLLILNTIPKRYKEIMKNDKSR